MLSAQLIASSMALIGSLWLSYLCYLSGGFSSPYNAQGINIVALLAGMFFPWMNIRTDVPDGSHQNAPDDSRSEAT